MSSHTDTVKTRARNGPTIPTTGWHSTAHPASAADACTQLLAALAHRAQYWLQGDQLAQSACPREAHRLPQAP